MKKLMIAVGAAALVGGAFAANIFDYKASVKYVDAKTVSAKTDWGVKEKIYVKVVKSATLTGYLATPDNCPCNYADTDACRFGMEPGFLVIQNKAQKKYDLMNSYVKLMPANLLTEWWTTKSLKDVNKDTTLQAQGYLFAGVGKRDVPDPVASPHYGLGDYGLVGSNDTQRRTAATQCLFGPLNILDGATFVEPFLDQAGFGKAKLTYWKDSHKRNPNPCIVDSPSSTNGTYVCIQSLSGTLIGGSFLCLRNGQYLNDLGDLDEAWVNAENWICQGWDNHVENWTSGSGTNLQPQVFDTYTEYKYNVICGTWSIKVNTKLVDLCDVTLNVIECAQKLDRTFDLGTFDASDSTPVLNTFKGEFVEKWGL